MGKFKNENGKTRVGKFLQNIGPIADPILDAVGDLTGIKALNKISDMIVTDKELSENQKQQALSKLQLDLEDMAFARAMNSDIQQTEFASWMAKNVPYLMDMFILLIWGAMTIFIIAKAMKIIDAKGIDWTPILGIYSGVTGLATQIISFHRGSSMGSRMKDINK